ncbi:MAG: helix-hairpin-helix domain-containing protein [Alphaproteobacteria bacterium]|nr:helix-hairpin-helix domain-containing protein [Alphaproteobacteria bacterium]
MSTTAERAAGPNADLLVLRNIGKAMRDDLHMLGIRTVGDLATRDADTLFLDLCRVTGNRQDPCVHDTFAAAIHQARTGEALAWWDFTPARKARQKAGSFV